MKRFVAVLSSLLVLPAFAEVAPIYYDEVIEYTDEEIPVADTTDVSQEIMQPVVQPTVMSSRSGATGRAASRVSPSVRGATNTSARSVNARTTSASRNATQARSGTQSRAATSRAANTAGVAQRASRAATSTPSTTATTRRATNSNTGTQTSRAATIVQTDTVNAPLYTGRVSTRTSAVMARSPVVSVANTTGATTTTTTDAASTIDQIDELAQMADYCKAQYTSCMDNYCNVLDENQGRCTCSKNVKNYEKTEEALKEAGTALQDVAQQIQYIGLRGDEIETLFTQTEAEMQMQASSDNTQLKNSLDDIKNMIVGVKTGTATSTETGLSFDLSGLLDFNISGTGFDLGSLFGTTTTNTSSISNQRGEQLYKTAAARCKTAVLNTCQAQGVDIAVITNSYDMEIDKQCIVYERNLKTANENMVNTVRNAKAVLQKARLMVAQQKNSYDLRGCINALDSCMQDEFVCGTDYEYCLDPTGKYIVDGKIVVGSTPGQVIEQDMTGDDLNPTPIQQSKGLYATWYYEDNESASDSTPHAWANGSLSKYIDATMTTDEKPYATLNDTNMSKYLQYKIGYNQGNRNYGMCISVLNKCQDYTYENGVYQPDNVIIREYMARTLTQIKVAQDEVVSDYAKSCLANVSSCLNTNSYATNVNIAVNACMPEIVTCMSVNGDPNDKPTPDYMVKWVGLNVFNPGNCADVDDETGSCIECNRGFTSVDLGNGFVRCEKPDTNAEN